MKELCEHGNYHCLICEVRILNNVIKELQTENERLKAEIASHAPEGRNYTNGQYVRLLQERESLQQQNKAYEQYVATIINHYHHVLTYDLTQEGIKLVKNNE
jgi:hypothetical protein